MRCPIDTSVAPPSQRAGRSELVALVAIAFVCLLAAVWFLFGCPNSSSTSLDEARPDHSAFLALPIPSDTESTTQSSVSMAEPGKVVVVPPQVLQSNRFSGRFMFEDGSVPPEMNFRFDAYPPPTAAIEGCAHAARGRTDAEGAFVVEGLCPGGYVITPDISGLPPVRGLYSVPAENVPVVLSGYLLHVTVFARTGQTARESDVTVTYAQPAVDGRPERVTLLRGRTYWQGDAWFGLPDPGTCTIAASLGLERSRATELSIYGSSRTVDVPLVLDELSPRASLRVELRSCDAPRAIVPGFCLELFEPESGALVTRLSAQEAQEPVFPNLRAGSFRVRAVDSLTEQLVFYRPMSAEDGSPLELRSEQETTLQMCVTIGGRLSVLVRDSSAEPESRIELSMDGTSFTLDIQASGSSGSSRLSFRMPTEDHGLWEMEELSFEEQLVTQDILMPGTYTLTARAEGYEPQSQTVDVHAGELTPVTMVVRKQ